jgi:hypothetical protein
VVPAVQLGDQFVIQLDRAVHAQARETGRHGGQVGQQDALRRARRFVGHPDQHRSGAVRGRRFVALGVDKRQPVVDRAGRQRSAGLRLQPDQRDIGRGQPLQRPAGTALDAQRLRDDVDDVRVVPASRNRHPFQRAAGRRLHPHEQPVDRVVRQSVALDVRPDAGIVRGERHRLVLRRVEIGLLEAVRIHRHRRVGAERDRIVRDGGPGCDRVDRRNDPWQSIDQDFAAAVADVGVVDVVDERTAGLEILAAGLAAVQVVAEDQSAPVSGRRRLGHRRIAVAAQSLVVVRREVHAARHRPALCVADDVAADVDQTRCPQDLERPAAAVDGRRRTAHVDVAAPQLEHRAAVDHQGHALRNFQPAAVGQRLAQQIETDLVRLGVFGRRQQAVGAAVAHHADDARRSVAGGVPG